MSDILEKMIKLNADGVDFFTLKLSPPFKLSESYTFDEIKAGKSYPKQPYQFWKKTNYSKRYISVIDGNPTVEILGNTQLGEAFIDLNISAVLIYQGEEMCVWAVSPKDFNKIDEIPDAEWKDKWGWWRYATGSNITHYPTHTFMVNGRAMIGYYDQERLNSYVKLWSEDGEMTTKEAEEDYFSRKYDGIRSYLCDVIGASTESNVYAVAVDVATLNGTTFGGLFQAYGDK